MIDRTNEQWIEDLKTEGPTKEIALSDLRERLKRSVYYYLAQGRSDLSHLSENELSAMSDDLAQDATLRVMANIEHFRGESRFTTWANKIAVRLTISELRRARYRDFSLDALTVNRDSIPVPSGQISTASPAIPPEKATEQDDVMRLISESLETILTDRQYQALIAVALEGIPMDIVAEQMGTNRNALYKLIHDARKKLRGYLEAQGLSTDYILHLFEQ